mmetsp:Transcript_110201/g.206574  ORF Transcript_110201/g.206574 Transcript_110201/m.206574 type:complete len:221 (-) Transcript_110201:605-1267(-)
MQECLAAEHCCEVLGDTLEHLLDCCGVACKSDSHLQPLWWNVANTGLDVVRNPLYKIRRVFVLDVQHLLIHLFGGHASTEECGSSQIPAMPRISCAHHILRIEHLLRELWHGQCTILLRPTGSERCEACHEEVEPWERNQIHGDFSEVAVQLAREAEASCHARHCCRHKVVEITICRSCELQSAKANVIQRLIVKQEAFIRILNQLMKRQDGIVWFNHSI